MKSATLVLMCLLTWGCSSKSDLTTSTESYRIPGHELDESYFIDLGAPRVEKGETLLDDALTPTLRVEMPANSRVTFYGELSPHLPVTSRPYRIHISLYALVPVSGCDYESKIHINPIRVALSNHRDRDDRISGGYRDAPTTLFPGPINMLCYQDTSSARPLQPVVFSGVIDFPSPENTQVWWQMELGNLDPQTVHIDSIEFRYADQHADHRERPAEGAGVFY